MNKGKTGFVIGLIFSIIFLASAFSTLTSITLNSPANGENISGTFLLNATLPSTDTATIVDFWWFNGTGWNLIGENTTSSNNFTYSWDTSLINSDPVQVKANATDGSTNVTSTSAQNITIDNIFPNVENISNSSIGQWKALITFDSNELTNASIKYGSTTSLGNSETNTSYVSSHYVWLTNLTENKTYYYNVTGCDFSGNCNQSTTYNFNTLNINPLLENISVSVTNETAYITWDTSEKANSSINYGLTSSLGTISSNSTNNTSHAINLTGLTNGTTYYYNITSCDLVGNCNETGTFNFTTHLDDTVPVFTGGITIRDSSGNDVTSVSQDEYVNITASVGDNIAVDEVWAQVELQNGTVFNTTMSIISGSGTLNNNYLASLYYNCTNSGANNVTVFANDTSGNLASTSKNSWNVYGYFTLLSNTSTNFKNFTNGKNISILYTVINDRAVSDNYTFSFNLTNNSAGTTSINGSRGWLISSNGTTANSIASGAKAYFKINVKVPLNASNTFYANVKINSSSGKSETKKLSFPQETITINLPSTIKISNSSTYSGIIFEYYNYTNTSWMKRINVSYFSVSAEASSNITNSTFACGLYNGSGLKKAGVVVSKGNMSTSGLVLSNATCLINVSGVSSGNYNLTINVTDDKKHKGSAYKSIILPGSITISASNGTVSKGISFTLSGTSYYSENSGYKLVKGAVKAIYGDRVCLGNTLYNGAFSLTCPGISSIGTTNLNLTITGVFNISSSKIIELKVVDNSKTSSEKLDIVPSTNKLTLKNKSYFTVTVFNKYSSSKDVSISVSEKGDKKHFDITYNSSKVNIASNKSTEFMINLSSFTYPKPGSYTLIISSNGFTKEVTVVIPNFEYKNNSLNTNRFIEKEGNKTIFGIEVFNKLDSNIVLNITEIIPKNVVSNTNLITFNTKPVIIKNDPIVMWVLNLSAGEKKELTYSINKNISNDIVFSKPSSFITNFGNSSNSGGLIVQENNSNKMIYIVLIFILAGAGVFYILFKDELFKNKKSNFLKPGLIEKSKKKLLGDGKYHFNKKQDNEKDKSDKEPVFNFSGVERKDD